MMAMAMHNTGALDRAEGAVEIPFWERALAVYCLFHYTDALWSSVFVDPTSVDGSPFLRAFWYPIYLLGLLGFARVARAGTKMLLTSPILLVLLGLAFASELWSVDPAVTFRRSFALTMTTIFGIYLAVRYDWKNLIGMFAASFALMAVAALLGPLISPKLFIHQQEYAGAWKGVWVHKNQMGSFMARGVLACLCASVAMPGRSRLWLGFAGLCIVLVLLSQSMTSVLATLLGVSMFVALKGRSSPLPAFILLYAMLMIVFALAALYTFAPDALFSMLGRDSSLTGRAGIWSFVEAEIQRSPWFGHGYSAFWHDARGPALHIRQALWFPVPHSHNSWLELALDLGYFGAALVGWFLFVLLIRSCRKFDEPFIRPFAIGSVLVTLLFSMSETVLLQANTFTWVLLVALSAKLASDANGRRTVPRELVWRLPQGCSARAG